MATATAVVENDENVRTEATKGSSADNVNVNTLQVQLTAAQLELAHVQQKIADIRQQIRSIGYFEADSLLQLSDGGDEHIVTHIMNYLDIHDMGPCAMVCRTLVLGGI